MTVFQLHSEPVRDEWLDHYGHLNEAYYLVPFSNATWALQEKFAIGQKYFDRTGGALYTVESHIRYLKDVRAPALMEVRTMILGVDAKRIHLFHTMYKKDAGEALATTEVLVIHVDQQPRVTPMPEYALDRLRSVYVAHGNLPRPAQAGRRIGLQD